MSEVAGQISGMVAKDCPSSDAILAHWMVDCLADTSPSLLPPTQELYTRIYDKFRAIHDHVGCRFCAPAKE